MQIRSCRFLNILHDRYADNDTNNWMKVIRNISNWTFQTQEAMDNPEREYRERTLWDPFVEPLLDLATETDSHDLLVEVGTLRCCAVDTDSQAGRREHFHSSSALSNVIPSMCLMQHCTRSRDE